MQAPNTQTSEADERRAGVLGAALCMAIIAAGVVLTEHSSPALLVAAVVGLLVRSQVRSLAAANVMNRDVREARARAEALLREREALVGTINHQLIVSIAALDGRIVEVNDKLLAISGYERHELIGQNHRVLASGLHSRAFWFEMWKTVARGETWRGEVCNRRKDGSVYWVDSLIAPMVGADGRVERYLSIRADITWRKEAEAALAQQTALARELATRAESANRAKSSFLANMSHEIRTPMNGVLGMTELLLGMGLTPEQEEAARTIYRSADALLVILDDVLDLSKIEAGKLTFERLHFDAEELLHDVADLFRGRIHGKQLELFVRVLPGVPPLVVGDPSRLRQIVTNLVGNAVKFTCAGYVLVELDRRRDELVVCVSDTGPGIPLDRQGGLFEPFTQADVSTSRKYGGTGLGLAISRRLAQGMGGSLTLRSCGGEGACFELVLPLEPADTQAVGGLPLEGRRLLVVEEHPLRCQVVEEQLTRLGASVRVVRTVEELQVGDDLVDAVLGSDARLARVDSGLRAPVVLLSTQPARIPRSQLASTLATPCSSKTLARCVQTAIATAQGLVRRVERPPLAGAALPRRRVLLAEDNAINQRIARAMLEKLNCEVTVVEDGRAAVKAAELSEWDAIFMDWQMPELDGLQATAEIRANEVTQGLARVPIIAMTANVTAEDRARCAAAGMDDHVGKPIRSSDLEMAMSRLWTRRAA